MNRKKWLMVSGVVWLFVGALLLYKGFHLIAQGAVSAAAMGLAVGIGIAKGRFVLSKTALRIAARLEQFAEPISFRQAYPAAYWILIGSMMGLAMLLKIAPISSEVRGLIDLAIGTALVRGSLFFHSFARKIPIETL